MRTEIRPCKTTSFPACKNKASVRMSVCRACWTSLSSRTAPTVPRIPLKRAFHASRRLDIVKPFLLADIGEGKNKQPELMVFTYRNLRYPRMPDHPVVRPARCPSRAIRQDMRGSIGQDSHRRMRFLEEAAETRLRGPRSHRHSTESSRSCTMRQTIWLLSARYVALSARVWTKHS